MLLIFFTAILTLVVDQFSKYYVVTKFSSLVFYNETIAFSLPIPWYLPWVLIFSGGVIWLLVTALRNPERVAEWMQDIRYERLLAISWGLMLGGAVGNLVDRFVYNGRVVDFINLQVWPVFNLADSALVIGVLLFLLRSYIKRESSKNKEE